MLFNEIKTNKQLPPDPDGSKPNGSKSDLPMLCGGTGGLI